MGTKGRPSWPCRHGNYHLTFTKCRGCVLDKENQVLKPFLFQLVFCIHHACSNIHFEFFLHFLLKIKLLYSYNKIPVQGLCITRIVFLCKVGVLCSTFYPKIFMKHTYACAHTHTGTTLRHSGTHSKTKNDRKALKQNIASNLRRENEMQHLWPGLTLFASHSYVCVCACVVCVCVCVHWKDKQAERRWKRERAAG